MIRINKENSVIHVPSKLAKVYTAWWLLPFIVLSSPNKFAMEHMVKWKKFNNKQRCTIRTLLVKLVWVLYKMLNGNIIRHDKSKTRRMKWQTMHACAWTTSRSIKYFSLLSNRECRWQTFISISRRIDVRLVHFVFVSLLKWSKTENALLRWGEWAVAHSMCYMTGQVKF